MGRNKLLAQSTYIYLLKMGSVREVSLAALTLQDSLNIRRTGSLRLQFGLKFKVYVNLNI